MVLRLLIMWSRNFYPGTLAKMEELCVEMERESHSIKLSSDHHSIYTAGNKPLCTHAHIIYTYTQIKNCKIKEFLPLHLLSVF